MHDGPERPLLRSERLLLRPAERGDIEKGYGTEVMEMLMDFGFGELRLHRIGRAG